jgi:hypothetical protein
MKLFYSLLFFSNIFIGHKTLFSIYSNKLEVPKSIINTKIVKYSDFGAKGDGKTDDIDAIIAAHAYANEHNLKVKADEKAIYYIGGKDRTAIIQTDTDFGSASFIIDDSNVEIVVKDQNEPIELWIAKDASVPVYPFGLINVLDKMGLFLIQVLFVVLN